MELKDFLPVWNKLEENQQRILSESAFERKYLKGDILHNGNYECQGLFVYVPDKSAPSSCLPKAEKSLFTDFLKEIFVFFRVVYIKQYTILRDNLS